MSIAQDAAQASYIVAQDWAETFADAITCFNAEQVNKALFGSFATTHRADQPVEYDEICRVFLDLVDRRVLVPEFSLNGIPQEQLEEMRAIAEKASAPMPLPPPTAEEIRQREVEQCARDFRTLSGTAFKARWLGTRHAVYEAAFQKGLI